MHDVWVAGIFGTSGSRLRSLTYSMSKNVKFVAARSNLLVIAFEEVLAHYVMDILVPGRKRALHRWS